MSNHPQNEISIVGLPSKKIRYTPILKRKTYIPLSLLWANDLTWCPPSGFTTTPLLVIIAQSLSKEFQ